MNRECNLRGRMLGTMQGSPGAVVIVAVLVLIVWLVIEGQFDVGIALPSRFSLRTLLIATTLIAMILGLVVYLSS